MYSSGVIMSFNLYVFYVCRLAVVPVVLVALIITLVLVFFPRMSETIPLFQEAEVFPDVIVKVNVRLLPYASQ